MKNDDSLLIRIRGITIKNKSNVIFLILCILYFISIYRIGIPGYDIQKYLYDVGLYIKADFSGKIDLILKDLPAIFNYIILDCMCLFNPYLLDEIIPFYVFLFYFFSAILIQKIYDQIYPNHKQIKQIASIVFILSPYILNRYLGNLKQNVAVVFLLLSILFSIKFIKTNQIDIFRPKTKINILKIKGWNYLLIAIFTDFIAITYYFTLLLELLFIIVFVLVYGNKKFQLFILFIVTIGIIIISTVHNTITNFITTQIYFIIGFGQRFSVNLLNLNFYSNFSILVIHIPFFMFLIIFKFIENKHFLSSVKNILITNCIFLLLLLSNLMGILPDYCPYRFAFYYELYLVILSSRALEQILFFINGDLFKKYFINLRKNSSGHLKVLILFPFILNSALIFFTISDPILYYSETDSLNDFLGNNTFTTNSIVIISDRLFYPYLYYSSQNPSNVENYTFNSGVTRLSTLINPDWKRVKDLNYTFINMEFENSTNLYGVNQIFVVWTDINNYDNLDNFFEFNLVDFNVFMNNFGHGTSIIAQDSYITIMEVDL